MGIKYIVLFLILAFYTSFSVIFGISDWKVYFVYSIGIPLPPMADPGLSRQDLASACNGQQTGMGQTYKISAGPPEIDR